MMVAFQMIAFIEISQWVGGGLLLLLGGFIAVMNWSILFHQLFKNGTSSIGPLIGGVLLALGMASLPVEGLRAWCWTGLLLDFGCVPLFLWMGVAFMLGKHKLPGPEDDHSSNS